MFSISICIDFNLSILFLLINLNYQTSLKIYEDKVKEAPMDYATVSANFAEFLRAHEDDRSACSVEKRASKMLKKAH